MSILSKLAVGLCLALITSIAVYWYLQQDREREEMVERTGDLRLLALRDPTACMEVLSGLRKEGRISTGELLLLVELSLEVPGFTPDAAGLAELEQRLPDGSALSVLKACLQYHEGRVKGAVESLRALTDKGKDDRRALYALHRILWVRGLIEDRIRAKGALRELALAKDEWGYRALRVLVFSRPGPAFLEHEMAWAIEVLRNHPLVTSRDFLQACEKELVEGIEWEEDPVERAMAAVPGLVEIEDLGRWLVRLGENERALSLVGQVEAVRDENLFFIRFLALLQAGRGKEAQQLFEVAGQALPEADAVKARAYLAIAAGDDAALRRYHEEAVSVGSAHALLEVARMGLLAGKGNLVFEVFEQAWAMDRDAFGLAQSNQFLQLALASGRTGLAHRITSNARERFPYKHGNLNNHCYLSLLLGEDPKRLEREAERIVLAFPANPSFLSTLALAKVLAGKPEEAFEAMRARGNSPMLHGERALMAVILVRVGKEEDARKLARGLARDRMLPEEWALLEGEGILQR